GTAADRRNPGLLALRDGGPALSLPLQVLQQPFPNGEYGRFRPAGEIEAPEDAPNVRLDGADAHVELAGDLLVRPALRHVQEHLALSLGQLVQRPVPVTHAPQDRRILAEEVAHDIAWQPQVPGGDRLDGLDEAGARFGLAEEP